EQALDLSGAGGAGRTGSSGGSGTRSRFRGSALRIRSTCLRVLRIGRTHRTLPVLDPGEFDLVPAALFVPLLHTLEPAADDSRQREDQPPELPDVVHPHQTNSTLGARCPVR